MMADFSSASASNLVSMEASPSRNPDGELPFPLEADFLPAANWLIDAALTATCIEPIFIGVCERLRAAGLPIDRAVLSFPTLHPLVEAGTIRWRHAGTTESSLFPHTDLDADSWLKSPIRHVLENGLSVFHRQLHAGDDMFPICAELAHEGYVDYCVVMTEVSLHGTRTDDWGSAIVVSYATFRREGFCERDIAQLSAFQKRLGLAVRAIVQSDIARNIAETYLGPRAGGRMLAGQIRHGDGAEVEAVVMFCDLRGSTALAERLGPRHYLPCLNAFFNATAGAIIDEGGEVLDFIGDAVLGIFPIDNTSSTEACAARNAAIVRAVAAVDEALQRLATANMAIAKETLPHGMATEDRAAFDSASDPVLRCGMGLAVGRVLFGNIGVSTRLTFSVLGRAVNTAARLDDLTKTLGHAVLMTEEIAACVPDRALPLGAHRLAGFSAPMAIWGLNAGI